MVQDLDIVKVYGQSLGWDLHHRTILVEGTTDVALFLLAAHLELEKTGVDLLGKELAIVAAGEKDRGGTRGVSRELICLRGYARTLLMSNGRPRYRFVGLFDSDRAGNIAVKGIQNFDTSILEYKDVFRLRPIMPCGGNIDPKSLKTRSEQLNLEYKGLDWETEDLLTDDFIDAFRVDYPTAVRGIKSAGGMIHREFTLDGKSRLHKYIRENAMHDDLTRVINVIRAMRFYLGLPMADM